MEIRNKFECANIKLDPRKNYDIYYQNNKKIEWQSGKKQSWEEKTQSLYNLIISQKEINHKSLEKLSDFYEKALEEKNNEIEILNQSIKILQDENINFRKVQFEWSEKYLKLKSQIEKMKCCENCNKFKDDYHLTLYCNCDDFSGWELKA